MSRREAAVISQHSACASAAHSAWHSLCASVFSATDYGGVTKNSGAMLVLAWDKEKKNLMVVPKLILPECLIVAQSTR